MADSQGKSREPTRLRDITVSRLGGFEVVIDLNPQTARALGPNRAVFNNYLGVLARTKVSILLPSWDHVTEAEKNMIWQDLTVSHSFKAYYKSLMMIIMYYIFHDLFILFCRQTLSLKHLHTKERKLCHLLLSNGKISRQT